MNGVRLVRIEIDGGLPHGAFQVGGARIVFPEDDAALGRELRTCVIAVQSEIEAARLREFIAGEPDLELID